MEMPSWKEIAMKFHDHTSPYAAYSLHVVRNEKFETPWWIPT